MGKLYLPLEVDFTDDPTVAKLARYGSHARACRDLLVQMWCYCKRERSDGNVPAEIVGKLVYPDAPKIGTRDADRLVEVGIAERTEDGYYLAGYLKRNKSRKQLEAEAIKKAEAGRKGGKASGEVRKGEAEGKQGASTVLSQRQRQETETKAENDVEPGLGGDRPEPLRSVNVTQPPNDEVCTRHPSGNPTDEPCRGCQRVEERKAHRGEREAEKRRLAAEELARNCALCEGTHFVLDADKNPTRRKCTDHRRSA